jgi:hypothetical protein
MKVIDYFGPRIAKSKLSVDDTNELFEICKLSSIPVNKELVGLVREEVSIVDALRASNVYGTILENINQYINTVDSGAWEKVIKSGDITNPLELQAAWYNKQVAMEFNPIHNHRRSADLVCVIFPKITLDNSVDSYYINNSNEKQTGQLTFLYGEDSKNDFGKSQITVQPDEGDMFVFPSTLSHYTTPVLGDSVRYSISCNFNFSKLAQRLMSTLSKNEN